jgi:hypothetical protein
MPRKQANIAGILIFVERRQSEILPLDVRSDFRLEAALEKHSIRA